MGIGVVSVSESPSYFVTAQSEPGKGIWVANVLYQTELETLNFVPSDECVEIKFVNKDHLSELNCFEPVKKVAYLFNPTEK